MQFESYNSQTKHFAISAGAEEVEDLHNMSLAINKETQGINAKEFEKELVEKGLGAVIEIKQRLAAAQGSTFELSVTDVLACSDMLAHFADPRARNVHPVCPFDPKSARRISKIMLHAYVNLARYNPARSTPHNRLELKTYKT